MPLKTWIGSRPNLGVTGEKLRVVNRFSYLGSGSSLMVVYGMKCLPHTQGSIDVCHFEPSVAST